MENARKLADCYFYYYSTCTKGEACNFRHEPEALGCESMCFYWQQGKCFDQHCKLRHMELRKNRKQIPCYWETQPGGCRKKHCSFQHKNPQARVDGIAPSQPTVSVPGGREMQQQQQGVNRETGEGPPAGSAAALHQAAVVSQVTTSPASVPAHNIHTTTHAPNWTRQVTMEQSMLRGTTLDGGPQHGSIPPMAPINPMTPMAPINSMTPLAAAYSALQPVDSLVVNFEEESDSESVTGSSPLKTFLDDGKHRVDLLRLEQIQEATAAFYSYNFTDSNLLVSPPSIAGEDITEVKNVKRKLPLEYESKSLDEIHGLKGGAKQNKSLDFRVLSLDEIKERKKQKKLCEDSLVPNDNSDEGVLNVSTFAIDTINDHTSVLHISHSKSASRAKLKRKLLIRCEHVGENRDGDGSIVSNHPGSTASSGKLRKQDETENIENLKKKQSPTQSTTELSHSSDHVNSESSTLGEVIERTTLSNLVPDLVSCCTRKSLHNVQRNLKDTL